MRIHDLLWRLLLNTYDEFVLAVGILIYTLFKMLFVNNLVHVNNLVSLNFVIPFQLVKDEEKIVFFNVQLHLWFYAF